MVNITKLNDYLIINGDVDTFPFKNSKIYIPKSSIYFIIDESNAVLFKCVYGNYTLLTVNVNNLQLNGENISKENLIEKFDALVNNITE